MRFGTDGIRGIFGHGINSELAYKVGLSVSNTLNKEKILIAMDTRISSFELYAAVIDGLTNGGANVITLGVLPSPAVSFLVNELNASGGIMITASHNSGEYNGIKVFGRKGQKATPEEEKEIDHYISNPPAKSSNRGTVSRIDGSEMYIDHLIRETGNLEGLRVVCDCAHGCLYSLSEKFFAGCGATIKCIHNTPIGEKINDGCGALFPQNLIPYTDKSKTINNSSKNLFLNSNDASSIQEKKRLNFASAKDEQANKGVQFFDEECQKNQKNSIRSNIKNTTTSNSQENEVPFDIGFSFDGDGDRVCITREGKIISGETILYNLSKITNAKTVIGTILTNSALERELEKEGKKLLRTPVGDKHILSLMNDNGYILGGEPSGHYIIRPISITADGLAAAATISKHLVRGHTLKILKLIPQRSISRFASSSMLESKEVRSLLQHANSLLRDNGRLVIRMSGTEPKIRLMIESTNEFILEQILAEFDSVFA